MTWASRLLQPDVSFVFALRIRGLPYIFFTSSNPWGGSTLVYQSETYTASNTLILTEDFGTEAVNLQPKAGQASGGGASFKVQLLGDGAIPGEEDLWLSLRQNAVPRSDGRLATTLGADLAPSIVSGAFATLDNPWSGGAGNLDLYLGDETIVIDQEGHTASSVGNIVKRGAYGSPFRYHRVTLTEAGETQPAGAGKAVADYPLRLDGRVVDLWVIPGDNTYSFKPYGDSLESDSNTLFYSGVLLDPSEGGNLTSITLKTTSLERLLQDARVLKRTPAALAGYPGMQSDRAPLKYFVGPHNAFLHIVARSKLPPGRMQVSLNADQISLGDTLTIGAFTFTCVASPTASAGEFGTGVDGRSLSVSLAAAINTPVGSSAVLEAEWAGNTGNPYGYVFVTYVGGSANSARNFPASVSTANDRAINCWPGLLAGGGDIVAFSEPLVGSNPTNGSRQPPYSDPAAISPGEYTRSGLNTLISCTLTNAIQKRVTGEGAPYVVHTALEIRADAEGRPKVTLRAQLEPRILDDQWSIELHTSYGEQGSILRDLGFTESTYTLDFEPIDTDGDGIDASNFTYAEIEASKPIARFRWPAEAQIKPNRVYLRAFESPWARSNIAALAGYVDDDGATIARHAKIAEAAIIRFAGFTAIAGTDGGYLTGVEWASELGRGDGEEVYIECEPPSSEEGARVERVAAFPNTSFNRSLLYMMLGGYSSNDLNGAYDKGIPDAGWGLALQGNLVDQDSVLDLDAQRREHRDNLVVTTADTFDELVEGDLVLTQQQLVSDFGQIRMIAMEPPSEAEASAGWRLVEGLLDKTEGDTGVDRQINRLVNVVRVQAGYDNVSGRYVFDALNKRLDSIETYGEQDTVELEVRSLSSRADAAALAGFLSARLFGAYARVYTILEEEVADLSIAWRARIGDIVQLSDSQVPSSSDATRGVVDLPTRLYAAERRLRFPNSSPARHTLVARAYAGSRWSSWSPSMLVLNPSEIEAEVTTFTAFDANFTRLGLKAIDYFEVGDAVRLAILGSFGTVWPATIESISVSLAEDASTVTISTPINLAGGEQLLVWFDQHDQSITTRQRKHVYFGSATNRLTPESGSDVEGFTYA